MLDITFAAAGGAGVISFLSPCVLPLVPAYLCFVAGTSLDQVMEDGTIERTLGRRVALAALAFVLGFSTVFVLMGASASAINQLMFEYLDVLAKVAGVVIVLFGLHFMGLLRIPWLYREVRFHPDNAPTGLIGAYVIGVAFAFRVDALHRTYSGDHPDDRGEPRLARLRRLRCSGFTPSVSASRSSLPRFVSIPSWTSFAGSGGTSARSR